MNKFVKSGSKLFVFAACFFIFTLFVDQANILDIFIGNDSSIDIEHPEEVQASLVDSPTIFNHVTYDVHKFDPNGKIKLHKDAKSNGKKILIDEDSPSTETIPFDVSILGQSFTDEQSTEYIFVSIAESLYLHNKTLLI